MYTVEHAEGRNLANVKRQLQLPNLKSTTTTTSST